MGISRCECCNSYCDFLIETFLIYIVLAKDQPEQECHDISCIHFDPKIMQEVIGSDIWSSAHPKLPLFRFCCSWWHCNFLPQVPEEYGIELPGMVNLNWTHSEQVDTALTQAITSLCLLLRFQFYSFNQSEFFDDILPIDVHMGETGMVYIPSSCQYSSDNHCKSRVITFMLGNIGHSLLLHACDIHWSYFPLHPTDSGECKVHVVFHGCSQSL